MNERAKDVDEAQRSFSDDAWNAVAKRDRHCDGTFVYAAVTTGIYCRPSCPARHPHRHNTLLFLRAEDAEREGFVPCHRCSPGSNSLTLAEKCIKAVLEYLDVHFSEKITLNTLARVTGLCPSHLQKTFTCIVGVSPKAYCDARRLSHFKELLRNGEAISDAIYEAGYQSSRAVYEQSNKSLGMTPSTYRRGGEGVRIRYSISDATLGRMLVAGTERGICAVLVGEDDKLLIGELRDEFPRAVFRRDKVFSGQWFAAAQFCQSEDPLISKLSRIVRKQVFQVKMWKALRPLPPSAWLR